MTSVALALCLARTLGTGSPSRKGRSMKNGGFFGFGDQAAAEASIARAKNGCVFTSSSVLSASIFFIISFIAGFGRLGSMQHGLSAYMLEKTPALFIPS